VTFKAQGFKSRGVMLRLAVALGGVLCAAHDMGHRDIVKNPIWPPLPDVPVDGFDLDYVIDGTVYQGYVAVARDATTIRPGALVAHQFMGLGATEKYRVQELAAQGYVAFASDMYGRDTRPRNADEARAMLTVLRNNPAEFRKRTLAGLDVLSHQPLVNASALFATGYCAGGQLVMELARWAIPNVLGVSAFHMSFGDISPGQGTWTAAAQVHHGELDNAGDNGLLQQEAQFKARRVAVWETIKYGGARHGFTDPQSAVYDPRAAHQSHAATFEFFSYLHSPPPQQ